jgi:uncharacterized protein (DUF4415 family)
MSWVLKQTITAEENKVISTDLNLWVKNAEAYALYENHAKQFDTKEAAEKYRDEISSLKEEFHNFVPVEIDSAIKQKMRMHGQEFEARMNHGDILFQRVVSELNRYFDMSFSEVEEHEPRYRTIAAYKEICIALSILHEKMLTSRNERCSNCRNWHYAKGSDFSSCRWGSCETLLHSSMIITPENEVKPVLTRDDFYCSDWERK